MSETTSKMQQYVLGLKAGVPVILGFVPVGIAYAIMAQQAGFSVFETIFMSAAVFAGASQMMAVGMYVQGAGAVAMILATFILNLRHLIMSSCVVHRMEPSPLGLRLLAAFGVTDESFAMFTTGAGKSRSPWFFLGIAGSIYFSWNLGTLLGALAMDLLPPLVTASLGISLYAMFISILIPGLSGNGRLAALVLLTALCNTLLCRFMASSWALIVSTLVCAFAGVFFVDLKEAEDESA